MLKRHLASQGGEKKKKAKKPKPVDDDLNDGKPIDAPIIEPLSPGDPDAAALRWQNVDPLRVGTVSARVLQPVGSPLDMSYMPGYQTMMNTSASSMYGPDHLPNVPAHGITNRTMNSTGDLAEVPPPPFSPPKLAMGQQSTREHIVRVPVPASSPLRAEPSLRCKRTRGPGLDRCSAAAAAVFFVFVISLHSRSGHGPTFSTFSSTNRKE
jgi:hypothetical protein